MATLSEDIINFLYTLKLTHSKYMNELAIKDKMGLNLKADNFTKSKYKGFLLGVYLHIIEDYFNVVNEQDGNFFTTDEIHDILQHFNNIADTNHFIDFNNLT